MDALCLFEPEETVGTLWHKAASTWGGAPSYPEAATHLDGLRSSLAMLFRALGGDPAVDIAEAPRVPLRHRRGLWHRIGHGEESLCLPTFDGSRLRLPPVMDAFPDAELNRAACLWLAASAALCKPEDLELGYVQANARLSDRVFEACPGLRPHYKELCEGALAARRHLPDTPAEAMVCAELTCACGKSSEETGGPVAPVPFWLVLTTPAARGLQAGSGDSAQPPAGAEAGVRKTGQRRDLDQANRKDSFIVHRFESILSWVESMNINRSVDDDDENAKKAADDQESVTLSKHDRKAATRLRLHLDLAPSEAKHERLAGEFIYPEWNHRTRSYMPDHVRVLDAAAQLSTDGGDFVPDRQRAERVRRQFEALYPRRMTVRRQMSGSDLDLQAVVEARAALRATGQGSNRLYLDQRTVERDLSAAVLMDTSRSTETALGDTSVIDVARDVLAAMAQGIDSCGDRLGIWGFSSLRRDRVFLSRCKGFDEKMSAAVTSRIGALRPANYTRLGAALRHVSAQLGEETSERRLLLVLTDGKPNDLDHYEGQHGIEDSRMAVREARQAGLIVHGVVVDEDGQDWFPRIFGKGGFTLLPRPERLPAALPEIYRNLTKET